MKRLTTLLAMCAIVMMVSGNVYAQDQTENILGKIKNKVMDVITGEGSDGRNKSDGGGGNENALDQIDKNLDKHGGSHKGLENARAAVSKSKGKKGKRSDGDVADDIIEDIADSVEEEITNVFDDDERTKNLNKKRKNKGKSRK